MFFRLLWLDEDFEPICSRLSQHLKTIGNGRIEANSAADGFFYREFFTSN
jgi:hypothetical protein